MKCLFITFLILVSGISQGQVKHNYMIFNSSGSKVPYSQMIEKLSEAEVIFFGELHNNAIAHWLQTEILKELHAGMGKDFVIGAEMFEADNQLLIDELFGGLITEKKFEDEARLWSNYSTDYKPILQYAKENNIPFIATNIPRRYASLVAQKNLDGLNQLSERAKEYIAPLPIEFDPEVECYKKMMNMGHGMPMKTKSYLPQAQAAKDATMAYFLHKNRKENAIFYHLNGSYHSDYHEGIIWYLKKQDPDVKVLTISTVVQEDIDKLDEKYTEKADYILVVDSDMTNTY